jgi:putative addiction module component (TIGR02574 family)
MPNPIFDFSHLTPEERIQLVEALWESLAETPESLPLTDAQAEELDRRVEACERDRSPGRLRGRIHMADDFDNPLPEEIVRLFRGEGE